MENSDKRHKTEPAENSEFNVKVRLFGLLELENQYGVVEERVTYSALSWLMLKYLLVNPGREVSQDELRENLWPDQPETNTEGASRLRLCRLRDALKPLHLDGRNGLVLCHRYVYSLNPQYALQTDAQALLELMKQIRDKPADDPEGLTLCVKALELFRGPFLEHTELGPWLAQYRNIYHQQFCDLARQTLARMKTLDDDQTLDLLCGRTLAIIPEEEELHREIISYMIGQKQQAKLERFIAGLSSRRGVDIEEKAFRKQPPLTGRAADSEHDVNIRLFGLVELENKWGHVTENLSWPSYSWLLLKYLLVNAGREVPQEELVENIWPEKPDVNTRYAAGIRRRRLREALRPLHLDGREGLLLFSSDLYSLNPDYTLWTDTDMFFKLMTRIRNSSVHDPEGLKLCVQALELFRGPFMEHTKPAPWLTPTREYYSREFRDLARETLERMKALGDDQEITLLCRGAAAIVPEEAPLHQEIISYMIERKRQVELVRYVSHLSRYSGAGVDWLKM